MSAPSQGDTEQADLALERQLLKDNPAGELDELTHIYERRGPSRALARTVAEQLTLADALEAHARDESGLSPTLSARPLQAALTSGTSFIVGSLMESYGPHLPGGIGGIGRPGGMAGGGWRAPPSG